MFLYRIKSKSNSKNLILFVCVIYMSVDSNFMSTTAESILYSCKQILLRLDNSKHHVGLRNNKNNMK